VADNSIFVSATSAFLREFNVDSSFCHPNFQVADLAIFLICSKADKHLSIFVSSFAFSI
jgi:hypothetical protein